MKFRTRPMKKGTKAALVVAAVLAVLAVAAFVVFDQRLFHATSPVRPEPVEQLAPDYPRFASSVDAGGDGVDDQADVLQGALDYVATQPRYKSKYYAETGYPDDGFGVCTDVVAQACRAAGYDLMQLVQEDVAAAPEAYGIDVPDPAIDFRRTRNLAVYLERNAVSLTTDRTAVEQWQGGDIVVFGEHIGIVSDRRNERGVPYVIHHLDPLQSSYEEDILESWDEPTGHYRMSE